MDFYTQKETDGITLLRKYYPELHNITTTPLLCEWDFETTHYVGEVKTYNNPEYPRTSDKYKDYQIDYAKLQAASTHAKETNKIPLLVVHFTDKSVLWNLNEVEWESSGTWVKVNKKGKDYGKETEMAFQAHLNLKDAKAVREYTEPIITIKQ